MHKESFSIRRVRHGDAAGILECLHSAFAPYQETYTPAAFADTVLAPDTIRHRLREMSVFVAIDGPGEIIGTIGCAAVSRREGHLRGMAVLPHRQGQGVAERLLQAAEEELRARKCSRATLDTTAPLVRAIRFYEKHGYRSTGAVADFFGMPLFGYSKNLSERETSMKETPQQYTQRILGFSEGKNPLAVQAATAGKLARAIRGLTRAQLRKAPAPGKWSVCEILAHLAEAEIVIAWRLRSMISSSGAPIQAYDQNAWAANQGYSRMDASRSLETFRVLRAFNLALLKSLKPETLERYGMHSERGKETVAHTARMMAGHDLNHLGQVERIRRELRRR